MSGRDGVTSDRTSSSRIPRAAPHASGTRSRNAVATPNSRRQSHRTTYRGAGEDGGSDGSDGLSRSVTLDRERTHEAMPLPPMDFPLARGSFLDVHDRKSSMSAGVLKTPQMRSQRLIGNSNPRYQW